jgi:hypothetical protein
MTKEHLYYYTVEIIKLIKYFIQNPHPSKSFYDSGLKKIGNVLQVTLSNIQSIYYQYNLKPLLVYHSS